MNPCFLRLEQTSMPRLVRQGDAIDIEADPPNPLEEADDPRRLMRLTQPLIDHPEGDEDDDDEAEIGDPRIAG